MRPLCGYHFSIRRQKRFPKTNSPKTNCAPKTNSPPKTNSEDECPEDELPPENEFHPKDEFRRRIPRRRIAPRRRISPRRRIANPEDELRPEDEFPHEDELRTPKTNYMFPRRNPPRRQISKTNSPKTNCVPNASRQRTPDELRRRIPRPKTHSEDEFPEDELPSEDQFPPKGELRRRIPEDELRPEDVLPPKTNCEDEFPEDDLRPEDDKLPPPKTNSEDDFFEDELWFPKTDSSSKDELRRRIAPRGRIPPKTYCEDEFPKTFFPHIQGFKSNQGSHVLLVALICSINIEPFRKNRESKKLNLTLGLRVTSNSATLEFTREEPPSGLLTLRMPEPTVDPTNY